MRTSARSVLSLAVMAGFLGLALVVTVQAQYGGIGDLQVAKPEDKQDMKSVPPPTGAIVLFDGKNLDAWKKREGSEPPAWMLVEGNAVQVHGSGGSRNDIVTKQTFDGRFHLHVEFRVPYKPNNKGQARGNSGVYVQGRYEVQVLDSYGLASKDNDCAGIYGVAAPLKNACKAPTIWQCYDIEFQAPKCEGGKKVAPARITVYHNGVKVHDNVAITKDNTTGGLGGDVCTPGPILLQDHGDAVQYRNIWLLKMKD